MKTIFLIFFKITLLSSTLFSQETINLTVSAQGKTKEEAKYNAFRDALERAFGTFISSNTQILNDEIIKDEIVSISSGNIEKFEIKSEVQLPDGTFANVIDVTVSLNKLKSFCESKGINVEFQGSLFAANIRIEKMNKENEENITRNMFETVKQIIENGIYNYTLTVEEPKTSLYYSDCFDIGIVIVARFNKNIENIASIIESTIKGIALSNEEKDKYEKHDIEFYTITMNSTDYYLRNWESVVYLKYLIMELIPCYSLNFEVTNGLKKYNFREDIAKKKSKISGGRINDLTFKEYDYGFLVNGSYRKNEYSLDGKSGYNYTYSFEESSCRELDMKNYSPYKIMNGYRYYETKNYLNINFKSIYGDKQIERNFQIFNFAESLTLPELEKITEYRVNPISN